MRETEKVNTVKINIWGNWVKEFLGLLCTILVISEIRTKFLLKGTIIS